MRILIVVLFLGFSLVLRAQVTIQVPSAGYTTIQSALNAAQTGDTVEVLPAATSRILSLPAKSSH